MFFNGIQGNKLNTYVSFIGFKFQKISWQSFRLWKSFMWYMLIFNTSHLLRWMSWDTYEILSNIISQLASNLTTKTPQTSIEINGKLNLAWWNFLKLCTLFQMCESIYIRENIWRDYSLSIISVLIKFKVLSNLPKSFHGLLTIRIHCNWPTYHAIDHSSIG